jgi:hypothetical protein
MDEHFVAHAQIMFENQQGNAAFHFQKGFDPRLLRSKSGAGILLASVLRGILR